MKTCSTRPLSVTMILWLLKNRLVFVGVGFVNGILVTAKGTVLTKLVSSLVKKSSLIFAFHSVVLADMVDICGLDILLHL